MYATVFMLIFYISLEVGIGLKQVMIKIKMLIRNWLIFPSFMKKRNEFNFLQL